MPALELHVNLRPGVSHLIAFANKAVVRAHQPQDQRHHNHQTDDGDNQQGSHESLSFRAKPVAQQIREQRGGSAAFTVGKGRDQRVDLTAVEPQTVLARATVNLHSRLAANADTGQSASATGAATLTTGTVRCTAKRFAERPRRDVRQLGDLLELATVKPRAFARETVVDLDSLELERDQRLSA